MTEILPFEQIGSNDAPRVGGKGLSLAHLARAGMPVPPGFCIASSAHERLRGQSPRAEADLSAQILQAYRQLGGGPVAVRSSATAEDGTVASFAGQQETLLGVRGDDAVLDAIARCWESLDTERAVAYRRHQGIREHDLAMAVVVQRLVPAECSGVLFTRDPLDAAGRRMLVEASWGLGESVVSGRVTPDRYHLDRETSAVLARQIAHKTTLITAAGMDTVAVAQQDAACLSDAQLVELAELGRRVEALYGDARDIEWAWAEGRFWLLQARPITATGAAEREQVRREEMAALAARAAPEGTVWSRFNLSEVLPEPTPMTWAIVRRFLSGRGGLGLMYRDLGFDPDPALAIEGIYDLVCGRPYCNLSREPRMQFRALPFEHSFAALKAAPHQALYPQATFNPSRAGARFWLLLPWVFVRLMRSSSRLRSLSLTCAQRLREEILPAFSAETAQESAQDYGQWESARLRERLEYWIQRTLQDFARDSLKPTVLAAVALGNLERALTRALGAARTRSIVGELAMGARPDPEADLPAAARELAAGRLDRQTFLKRFGHRGNQEMELSQPRWAEAVEALERGQPGSPSHVRGQTDDLDGKAAWERTITEAKWSNTQRTFLERELHALHTYLGLRETTKHYLMKGYALIRRILVELDRRHQLAGGIFYLTPDELPALAAGTDFGAVIAGRRRRRKVALNIEVPSILFSDDLEAIGRPLAHHDAEALQGVPLSAGVAEGPALVLQEPTATTLPEEGYILVCPSTDPAWVPLFVHARGLVMETGGVLSHGAIVAREFGLPAVAGLPNVHRELRTGERLRVDGGTGRVTRIVEAVELPRQD